MDALKRPVRALTAQPWFRLPRQPMLRHLTFAVLAGVGLYFLTNWLSAFNDYQAGQVAFYAIALAGLTLLTGINGQISLGSGGFMAVGAFTLALLYTHTNWNLVPELAIAVAVSVVAGGIIGIPATRLRGPYLAGMTLTVALGLPYVTNQYNSIFGGDQGLTTPPPTGPSDINPEQWLAWIQLLCALIVLVLLGNLLRSRFGRSFRAVRDDEIAASLAGINVPRTKVIAFMVSSGCAGLAGALLALSAGVTNSAEFPLALSIYLLAGVVLGGTGSLMGVWWGAIIVVYLPNEWARSLANAFHANSLVSANLAIIIFGLVLVVMMMVAPAGIQGALRWVAGKVAAYFSSDPVTNMTLPLQEPPGSNINSPDIAGGSVTETEKQGV
ncbi:MAG TPA: branched-chain amino acid ABC transporter permease [Acidimicrobiales bacterium]|nr:branched-chain amino acid ABC transporter permease [Acidimicrobiales bacterium]